MIDSFRLLFRRAPFAATSKMSLFDVSWAVIFFLVYLGLALRDLRVVLYDDAAITFRYAHNIFSGVGFVYNAGDPTNGASAPLYTLLLSGHGALGIDLEDAARTVGVLSFAFVGTLVYLLGARISGQLTGVIASVLLLFVSAFRENMFSGMESAFAAFLGLLAIYFLVGKKYGYSGIFAGLALFNKLDAFTLLGGIVIALILFEKAGIKKFGLSFGITFLPWLIFSTIYFGSPVPFSASQKLQNIFGGETALKDPGAHYDPAWLVLLLRDSTSAWLITLAFLGLVFLALWIFPYRSQRQSVDLEAPAKLAAVALSVWFLGHLLVFSIVNLGAPYPWYSTVLYPPLALLAGAAVGGAFRFSQGSKTLFIRLAGLVAGILLLTVVGFFIVNKLPATWTVVESGHQVSGYEDFEATRKAAGEYIRNHAGPGDVIETCFGWVAYGGKENPIKETCPLSTRLEVGEPSWAINVFFPTSMPSHYVARDGWKVAKVFWPQRGGPGTTIVLQKEE